MKFKNALCGLSMLVVLHFGLPAGFAQTNRYVNSGAETEVTLNPGAYIITAYGAFGACGAGGAEMSAEFNFSTSTTLTLLVGGIGVSFAGGSGGGGGSFVVEGSTPLVIAGGGGGTYPGLYPGAYPGCGNVSTNGSDGDGVDIGLGGTGGTAGGGGGGGFLGNGGDGTGYTPGYGYGFNGGGGSSFVAGGYGGFGGTNAASSPGGYGGGGGGGSSYTVGQFGYGEYYNGGGGGGGGGYSGGGGSGGTYGGGGGSFIDSSAITNLAEVPGQYAVGGPDGPSGGEIIIIAVPTPLAITTTAAFGFTNGLFGFEVSGPFGSNVVIQASTDLRTWVPLQTNALGSGALYFSDAQSPTNAQRFYRARLSP